MIVVMVIDHIFHTCLKHVSKGNVYNGVWLLRLIVKGLFDNVEHTILFNKVSSKVYGMIDLWFKNLSGGRAQVSTRLLIL